VASGPSSFTDGLQTLASDAMRLATLPDADPVFCMKLAQAVVAKARAPAGGPGGPSPGPAAGGGPPGVPGGPRPGPGIGPGGMPGGPPGGSPANPAMPTQGAPTMGPGPSQGLNPRANNGDEIRRMIAGATA
jgi:hypothetical protein